MINKDNIEELLAKYFAGEASPEEAMAITDWKNHCKENEIHFSQYAKLMQLGSQINADQAWDSVKRQLGNKAKVVYIRPVTYYFRIAASVLLIIAVGAFMRYWFSPSANDQIAFQTGAEVKQVQLSDGSEVTISPNSSLTAENEFGGKERRLRLKGTAYFTVVHDEAVPFVVNAGGVFIKDIGTQFLIQTSADTDTVYVHVDEGVVLLFDDKDANIEIKAGGSAIYVKSTRQLISQNPAAPVSKEFIFSNSTLGEVVAKLNVAYQTKIEIANPALTKCPITTQFDNEKLETVLSVIAETLGITFEKTQHGFIFKGDQCRP